MSNHYHLLLETPSGNLAQIMRHINGASPEWLKTDFILGYFGRKAPDAKNKYRRFGEDLLDNEYESPLKATIASTVLGRSEFVREVSERRLPHFLFTLLGNYRELIEGD